MTNSIWCLAIVAVLLAATTYAMPVEADESKQVVAKRSVLSNLPPWFKWTIQMQPATEDPLVVQEREAAELADAQVVAAQLSQSYTGMSPSRGVQCFFHTVACFGHSKQQRAALKRQMDEAQ